MPAGVEASPPAPSAAAAAPQETDAERRWREYLSTPIEGDATAELIRIGRAQVEQNATVILLLGRIGEELEKHTALLDELGDLLAEEDGEGGDEKKAGG